MSNIEPPKITQTNSTGGSHMSGDAEFSDGKKYRFVIDKGEVKRLMPYMKDDKFDSFHNMVNQAKTRCAALLPLALKMQPEALKRKEERDALEDAKTAQEIAEYRKKKALRDAAPELQNALQLAQATIERLHRHAPGSANGTLDVIKKALELAEKVSDK